MEVDRTKDFHVMRNQSDGNKVSLSYDQKTGEFRLENEETGFENIKVDGFVDFDEDYHNSPSEPYRVKNTTSTVIP
jgi:hypothetical protein